MEDGCPEQSGLAAAAPQLAIPDDLDIRILRLEENCGQQAAVFCGLEASRGKWVITMDDDLQHPPFLIPALLERRRAGADLIWALPSAGQKKGRKGPGSLARDLFFRLCFGLRPGTGLSSFRLIRREAVDRIRGRGRGFVYVSALLLRANPGISTANLYYHGSRIWEEPAAEAAEQAEQAEQAEGQTRPPSRIPGRARLALYLRLVLKYGVLRGRSLPGAGPVYRIKEEL